MSNIYKLIYLDQDNIKKMIVFFGDKGDINVTDTFNKNNKDPLFDGLFSKYELDRINSEQTNVVFSKQIIYIDDTIETIKKKIIEEFSRQFTFDEIYLFSKQLMPLNNSIIYNSLTQNGKIILTQDILFQFLSNIDNINIDNISIKDTYTYNDIIDLNLTNNKQKVNVAIGQRFIMAEDMYSFTINPFKNMAFSNLIKTNIEYIITTTNKELLLSTGDLFENTLYLCLIEDVLKYSIAKNISEIMTTKVYYPFLGDKNIIDLKQLQKNKLELLEQNKNLLNISFTKQTENIDMFHEIYNTRKTELKYIEQGIQTIEFVLSQESEYNVPLEIIFKLIHASKDIPFIKYNPSNKQEKIYRLYCDKIAKNGKKIPYLSKSVIFKLAKIMNTSKRVFCYIEYNDDNKMIPIIVSFDNYGNIYIKTEFKETKSIPDIENLIITAVNPVIKIVQKYILTSGYFMNLFNNLYDKNIEITNIKYFSYISIDKNINLNNLLGCVSSIFNVIVGELKKGIIMRYKRVSNFNEMDSQEAFIVELLNRFTDEEDIIKLLMDNFQLSKINAQLKIAELLNNLQVIQSLNNTRK